MSLEERFEEIVRKVVREELQTLELDDKLLTAEQAAEKLGYPDADSVRRLAREGHLTAVKLGEKTSRFKKSEVNRLIEHGIR
jgi:excisionase family DNA binding protein